jgi:hypothetical protein
MFMVFYTRIQQTIQKPKLAQPVSSPVEVDSEVTIAETSADTLCWCNSI